MMKQDFKRNVDDESNFSRNDAFQPISFGLEI